MEKPIGSFKITVIKGINLAVRDRYTSDPYVVITMGSQKLKTRFIKKNCNPVWNDILTIPVTDPNLAVQLVVFDKDTFTEDDRMGEANIDVQPYLQCIQMGLGELPMGTAVRKVQPNAYNCLADESKIIWTGKGKMHQEMILKLQKVEKGKIHIKIEWLNLPGTRGSGSGV